MGVVISVVISDAMHQKDLLLEIYRTEYVVHEWKKKIK